MDSDYVRQYRRLYDEHWWWRAREQAVVAVIRRHHRTPTKSDHVLDIGCGDALFFDQLSQFGQVQGLEVDADAVSISNPHAVSIFIGPFDHAFQPGRTFALITMLDVLEHLPDDRAAVHHLHQLLSDDGTLVLTVPAFRSLWTSHDDMNQHVTRYRQRELVLLLEDAGLQVVSARYLFHWVAAAKIATRAKEAIFGAKPKPPTVPAKPINAALRAASRFELRQGRGLGLPFGSSLIVVAKKRAEPSDG